MSMLLVATLSLGACSALPTSGPASWDVRSSQPKVPDTIPYALVKLDAKISTILAEFTRLSNAFANRSPPKEFRFGIGDIVSVTIFEAAAGWVYSRGKPACVLQLRHYS